MRKIGFVVLLIGLVSCASFGSGNKEMFESFEGTWVNENGSTMTINGDKYEVVFMAACLPCNENVFAQS